MYHCNLKLTASVLDEEVAGKVESSPSAIAVCGNLPVIFPSTAERLVLGDDGTLGTVTSIEAYLVDSTTHDIVSIFLLRFAA